MIPDVLVIEAGTKFEAEALRHFEHFFFVQRTHAEEDIELRQVIPYIVVIVNGSILAYRRSDATSEKRLVGSLSIGWGGHIEPIDGPRGNEPHTLETYIRKCAIREVSEELALGTPDAKIELGLIDEGSAVGRFHLGWLEVWTYRRGAPSAAADTASATLNLSLLDLAGFRDELEPWSQIAADRILSCGTDLP